MMRIFEGFRFARLATPIHRVDPRAKFVMTMALFVSCLLFTNLLALTVIFLIQIPVIGLARSTKRWLGSMRGGAILAILIFVMNFVTGATLSFSMAMTLRFVGILSSFSIFFMTTSPDDLGLALERLHVPYTISFTFTTAVRLVPTMAIDAQTVIDAQRSRGLELEGGNFLRRVRNYIPILIPLIVSAIRRSIELAEALESRAFGASPKRESLVVLKMKPSDYFIILSAVMGLAVSVYLSIFVQLPTLEIPIKMPLWQ